jgi:hypothetical protein
MSRWFCPYCGTEHRYASNPDVLDGGPNAEGKVEFTCGCGATFEMWVDFEPSFLVDRKSVRVSSRSVDQP